MSNIQGLFNVVQGGEYLWFRCPGCDEPHMIRVKGEGRPCWGFNGDFEKPTLTPSILVTWGEPSDNPDEFDDRTKDKKLVCHSFVTDGMIQFLGDCTHAKAGQTVPLVPWRGWGGVSD